MAKSGKALGENELNLANGGKVVLDVNNGSVLGYHLYGDVKGEDQGYFTKDEVDQLEAVAKKLGTSLDVVDSVPGKQSVAKEKSFAEKAAEIAAKKK